MDHGIHSFAVLLETIRDGLHFEAKSVPHALSERTVRSIAAGERVKPDTWRDYATAVARLLVNSPMFPFSEEDYQAILDSFSPLRESYEQLRDSLTQFSAPPQVIQRSLLRLAMLDLGVRYAGLCLASGINPDPALYLCVAEKAACRFWERALEKRFPNLPKVDGKGPEGDWATQLEMDPSKMRRCLYENSFPGQEYLQKVFDSRNELGSALRFYGCFNLSRKLTVTFGEAEIEYLLAKAARLATWLHSRLAQTYANLQEGKRKRLVNALMLGGIGSRGLQKMVLGMRTADIPILWRDDLLSLARSELSGVVARYVDFCKHYSKAAFCCWEHEYDILNAEMTWFDRNGTFPSGKTPSAKLALSRKLTEAFERGDLAMQERIFRQILSLTPDDPEAHQHLGQILEETGRLDEAWEEFEAASAAAPAFLLPLFRLAESQSRAGRHEDALKAIERIPPDGVGPGTRAYLLGTCLVRAQRAAEAIPCLEQSYQSAFEPGASADLLAQIYEQHLPDAPNSRQLARRWRKEAAHHGIPGKTQ